MATIIGPSVAGTIGVPPGKRFRVDFREDTFNAAIEQKGSRLVWSRGALCPCNSLSMQTKQADPNCELCDGHGWYFFGPKDYVPPVEAGELDDLQKVLVAKDGGAVIRGFLTSVGQQEDPVTQLGTWMWGSATVTVRPENRLGYYDRLVHLDSVISHTELVEAGVDGAIKTRFLITGVNLLRTTAVRMTEGTDFLLEKGVIKWISGHAPAKDTQLSIHYLCHPQWLVIEQPKWIREETNLTRSSKRTSPAGTPVALPIQALIRLEFLVT